jgi:hypothetical protein
MYVISKIMMIKEINDDDVKTDIDNDIVNEANYNKDKWKLKTSKNPILVRI